MADKVQPYQMVSEPPFLSTVATVKPNRKLSSFEIDLLHQMIDRLDRMLATLRGTRNCEEHEFQQPQTDKCELKSMENLESSFEDFVEQVVDVSKPNILAKQLSETPELQQIQSTEPKRNASDKGLPLPPRSVPHENYVSSCLFQGFEEVKCMDREDLSNWRAFKEQFFISYNPLYIGTVVGQLLRLRQNGTVKKHKEDFEALSSGRLDLPLNVLEETFIKGLREQLSVQVVKCRPVGLNEMIKLAKIIENQESENSAQIYRVAGESSNDGGGSSSFQTESVVKDIQDDCKLFEPIYDQPEGADGYVSVGECRVLGNSTFLEKLKKKGYGVLDRVAVVSLLFIMFIDGRIRQHQDKFEQGENQDRVREFHKVVQCGGSKSVKRAWCSDAVEKDLKFPKKEDLGIKVIDVNDKGNHFFDFYLAEIEFVGGKGEVKNIIHFGSFVNVVVIVCDANFEFEDAHGDNCLMERLLSECHDAFGKPCLEVTSICFTDLDNDCASVENEETINRFDNSVESKWLKFEEKNLRNYNDDSVIISENLVGKTGSAEMYKTLSKSNEEISVKRITREEKDGERSEEEFKIGALVQCFEWESLQKLIESNSKVHLEDKVTPIGDGIDRSEGADGFVRMGQRLDCKTEQVKLLELLWDQAARGSSFHLEDKVVLQKGSIDKLSVTLALGKKKKKSERKNKDVTVNAKSG